MSSLLNRSCVASASLDRLTCTILDRSRTFEKAWIFSFLGPAVNFLPYVIKGYDRPNRTTQQQSARVRITGLTFGRKRFVFGVKVVPPDNIRERLRFQDFSIVFTPEINRVASMDFGVIPREPLRGFLAGRRDQSAMRRWINENR